LDDDTAIRYIDRFLMYYIITADRLTRTSVWLEGMPGGIEFLRDVIVNDKLKICEELERQMQFLVDTYKCEWREVVEDPQRRQWFKQFVNTDETEPCIEFVSQRDQQRPVDWPKDVVPLEQIGLLGGANVIEKESAHEETIVARDTYDLRWVAVGRADYFPIDGGAAVKYGKTQLAVFNFASRGQWYATQNMCPHKKAFVLARGILGEAGEIPKVACPLHKKTFSLETGKCTTDEPYNIQTFRVKIEGGEVYLELPPEEKLNESLATEHFCVSASCSSAPVVEVAATIS
jgi:nitrite reductase (NADH) large subunit